MLENKTLLLTTKKMLRRKCFYFLHVKRIQTKQQQQQPRQQQPRQQQPRQQQPRQQQQPTQEDFLGEKE